MTESVPGEKAEESGMPESLPGEKAKGADTTSPGSSEALQLDNLSVPEPAVDALLAAAEQGTPLHNIAWVCCTRTAKV